MSLKNNFKEIVKDFSLTIYSITSTFSLAAINFSLGLMCLLTVFNIIKNRAIKLKNNKILVPIIIFIIAISISMMDSINTKNSLDYLNRFIYPLLAFFIIRLNYFSLKKIKKYSCLILFSIFLNLIYAYYQYFNGVKRIHGSLFVMEFAGLVAFLSIFCFIYIWNPENHKISKYYMAVGFLISIIGIVLTGTRGVWISATSSIFILIFLLNKKKLFKYLLIFLLITIILFMFLPDYYLNRFISIFDFNTNSSNITRFNLWRGALLIFRDNPFNGIGINNFGKIIDSPPYFKKPMVSKAHTHNNYLQLLAETGIIGLISFLFLNYKIFITLFNLIKNTKVNFNKYYYYFVLGIYINYLLQGLTEYNLVDRYMSIVVWIFIAFSFNISELKSDSGSKFFK